MKRWTGKENLVSGIQNKVVAVTRVGTTSSRPSSPGELEPTGVRERGRGMGCLVLIFVLN
jgi:hypothetical protein